MFEEPEGWTELQRCDIHDLVGDYTIRKHTRLTSYRVMLTFAISRGRPGSAELTPRPSAEAWSDTASPVSPLSTPLGDVSRLYRGCSAGTSEIVNGMQECTHIFLARWNHLHGTQTTSKGRLENYDLQLQNIYTRLLSLPSTKVDLAQDWIYESCRLAALIYCRSIVHGTGFADSANTPHADTCGTLLSALHHALGRTDTQNCWGFDLSGVFLWVTLLGAASSWSLEFPWSETILQSLPWMRKYFALYAIRAAVSVPFEHADTTILALRIMLQVRRCLAIESGRTMGQ